MQAILSIAHALSGVVNPPASVDGCTASPSAPVVAVACGDWIDLGLLLEDPLVETAVVDVRDRGDVTVVTAVHTLRSASSSDCVWVGFYIFPSTIFAHSIVTVPFHADEMD
jgi:hypothetical protein